MARIFISYSSKDQAIADQANDVLIAHYGVFLSSRVLADLAGSNFMVAITEALHQADALVILLSPNSVSSRWVELELTYAVSVGLPICPLMIADCTIPEYWKLPLANCQIVPFPALADLPKTIENFFALQQSATPGLSPYQRWSAEVANHHSLANKYNTTRFGAQKRLAIQGEIFAPKNKAFYDAILPHKKGLIVLDVGCNNGDNVMRDLGGREEVEKILGFDCSKEMIVQAIEHHLGGKLCPTLMDVESRSFSTELRSFMDFNKVERFDLINISMVLLHLAKAERLLENLRPFLAPDGVIAIRDIDDEQSVSYPDYDRGDNPNEHINDDIVHRFNKMNDGCAHTGNRHRGREIYTDLVTARYHDVHSFPECVDVTGLDENGRNHLFYVAFSYLEENIQDMLDLQKDHTYWQGEMDWFRDHIDDLERMFRQDDYYFKLGTVLFYAHP